MRQRKFQLLRRFSIPADALPGSLSLSHLRCGKPTCHCAEDRGHPVWSLTFMVQGKKRVQHIPKEWVEEVRRRVKAGREFQDAVREVLAANAQLLVLASARSLRKRKNERSTPRHLLHFVTRRLRLRRYLKNPGDGRQQPQIPAQALLWALLIGQILRQSSFHAVEALARSSARRTLSIATPFCDDTLGYFTERLDPGPTRQALLSLIRGAKRNKAFDDCRWIGLAIDGTGAGWRTHQGCTLCRPKQNAAKQIQGYQHSLVMISVVGTGLSLPCDGEPYGPGDSEYAAGQRLLRRVIGSVGKRFAQYVVVDGEFATAPFLHTAGELGLRVVARLKDNLPELFAAAQQRFPCGPPNHGFSAWSGSRGVLGRGGLRSLGNARAGKPFACSSIASTSRTARWWKPTG